MSYFTVIPAEVRHADILDGAKLLFGDIAGLSKKAGYCWATNAHLAEVSGVSERQVIRYIRLLEGAGFVRSEMVDAETRHIYLMTQVSPPPDTQVKGTPDVDVNHTNTSSTNTFTNDVSDYYEERGMGKLDATLLANEFVEYWAERDGGPTPDSYRRHAATWMKNAKRYGKLNIEEEEYTKEEFANMQKRSFVEGFAFDASDYELVRNKWRKR